jgi:hypothetical protein
MLEPVGDGAVASRLHSGRSNERASEGCCGRVVEQ